MARTPGLRPIPGVIQQRREDLRMSVAELSVAADLSDKHLYGIEAGRHNVSKMVALRIADVLRLPLEAIVECRRPPGRRDSSRPSPAPKPRPEPSPKPATVPTPVKQVAS